MAITSRLASDLVELYVSTFGRAPDEAGLNYWVGEVEAGRLSISEVAQSFFDQPEALEKFGDGDEGSFIDGVYDNLFGRAADAEGRDYWVGELQAGNVDRNSVVEAFLNAAKSTTGSTTDAAILANKTQVAQYYVTEVGANSNLAQSALASVTSDASSVNSAVELIGWYDDFIDEWQQSMPSAEQGPDGWQPPSMDEMWQNVDDDSFWTDLSANDVWNQEGVNRPTDEAFWEQDDVLWQQGDVAAFHNVKDNYLAEYTVATDFLNDWESGNWISQADIEWQHFDHQEVRDDAMQRYITLFDEAPSADELNRWIDDIEYGRLDQADLTGQMFNEASARYDGMSDEEFIRNSYERIFGESDGADLSSWDSMLSQQGDRSQIFDSFFDAADADPSSAAALYNRAQVADHYMTQVGFDSDLGGRVLDGVTWDPNSLDNGMGLVDFYDGWVEQWSGNESGVSEADMWQNIDDDNFWQGLSSAGTAPAGDHFWEQDDNFWHPNGDDPNATPSDPSQGWQNTDFINDSGNWHDTAGFNDFNDGYDGPTLPDGSTFFDFSDGNPPPVPGDEFLDDDFVGGDKPPTDGGDFPDGGDHPDGDFPNDGGDHPDGDFPSDGGGFPDDGGDPGPVPGSDGSGAPDPGPAPGGDGGGAPDPGPVGQVFNEPLAYVYTDYSLDLF